MLFDVMVITHIAYYLHIVGIYATIHKVSSFLGAPMTHDISAQIVNGNGGIADNRRIGNGSSCPTVDNNGRNVGRQ